MDVNAAPFLTVVIIGLVVILVSRALDVLWTEAISLGFFYSLLRAPGIIVHECSHILGCLITGAKVKKVVLFSEAGGSVTYSSPKIPYIGDLVINTAPLFCIPLVLAGFTWIFSEYLGCVFPAVPLRVDSMDALFGMFLGILGMFTWNLVIHFNPWFLVYLYLTLTLVLSVAPSTKDLKNAALGISIITLLAILVLWSSFSPAVNILWGITHLLSIGLTLGLLSAGIALVISTPLVAWFMYKKIQETTRPWQ